MDLDQRFLSLEGLTGVIGEPLFLWFCDRADYQIVWDFAEGMYNVKCRNFFYTKRYVMMIMILMEKWIIFYVGVVFVFR